jgi:phosphoenolpyruvate---glycerone phosphotransferase subunit DhaL
MSLDATWVVAWMTAAAAAIADQAPTLNDLDRAIGDGDHGENMNRGFTAVRDAVRELPDDAQPAEVLRASAMKLISSVGGAAGPLYGTALLRASDAVAGLSEVDSAHVLALLEAALGGIEDRGHAAPGDKTMVDAWSVAVDAARSAVADGRSSAEVLDAAADGAESGAETTDAMLPHKGRASYLGERAVGHRDPGAVSTAIILLAAAEVAK